MNDFSNIRGYNGNVNLKREKQQIEWTPTMLEEYVKCSKDVVYFTEKYMKIINVDRGLINFTLYDYQKEMLHNMQHERFNIIATARQAGKCVYINTPIRLRNKKTGEVLETTIGEFYESQCKLRVQRNAVREDQEE